jgi:hypothetical protein
VLPGKLLALQEFRSVVSGVKQMQGHCSNAALDSLTGPLSKRVSMGRRAPCAACKHIEMQLVLGHNSCVIPVPNACDTCHRVVTTCDNSLRTTAAATTLEEGTLQTAAELRRSEERLDRLAAVTVRGVCLLTRQSENR